MNLKDLLNAKQLVINSIFVNEAVNLNLSLSEFLILIYFDNLVYKDFDIKGLTDTLKLNENIALEAFNKLIDKKLISIVAEKDKSNKIVEKVNLDGFYSLVLETAKEEKCGREKQDIYSIFEKEFGRPISSMEYEIINAWIDKDFSEELIIGALKEAIYNGVTNLRYIDKILYEWQRKGFKNMKEVEKHLEKRKEGKNNQKNNEELFDYNWLDDDTD